MRLSFVFNSFPEYDRASGVFLTTDDATCFRQAYRTDRRPVSRVPKAQESRDWPRFVKALRRRSPRCAAMPGADAGFGHRRRFGNRHTSCVPCARSICFAPVDVRSWLYTILTNLNRDRLQSLARRPALSPIEDLTLPDLARRSRARYRRPLATLVDDQRNALLLVVLKGSAGGVAEVQGVPIGTVMSRLARARVQIKDYLDGGRPTLAA